MPKGHPGAPPYVTLSKVLPTVPEVLRVGHVIAVKPIGIVGPGDRHVVDV
jgi:hypothetical protein